MASESHYDRRQPGGLPAVFERAACSRYAQAARCVSVLRKRCTRRGICGSSAPQYGRLVASCAHKAAPADLLGHPALEIRLGRHPQIEVGIELAAEALDVEQRLLQQHELRLDLAC